MGTPGRSLDHNLQMVVNPCRKCLWDAAVNAADNWAHHFAVWFVKFERCVKLSDSSLVQMIVAQQGAFEVSLFCFRWLSMAVFVLNCYKIVSLFLQSGRFSFGAKLFVVQLLKEVLSQRACWISMLHYLMMHGLKFLLFGSTIRSGQFINPQSKLSKVN